MNFRHLFFALVFGSVSISITLGSSAGISIIRDAEIEDTLTEMAQKIFKVAKLNPKNAKVYVIDSADINAFTIGDGYIFITSGLLLKYDNPLHILAIMCHEVGHIAAGHIDRQISLLKSSSKRFGIAAIASIVAGALTGSGDSAALLLGYAMTDARFFLRFSRSEEFAADALAVSYLEKLNYSADVLIESFEVFRRTDMLNGMNNLPVYVSTHPKTDARINVLDKYRKFRHYSDIKLYKRYQHIITKLKIYTRSDLTSNFSDEYTQIFYLYKTGKSQEAISRLKKLASSNSNFYYEETLAQMLHETGNFQEAIDIYKKLYSFKINQLIKIDYASTLIDFAGKNCVQRDEYLKKAIEILSPMQYDPQIDSDVFRLLGKAHGMLNNKGLSAYFVGREQMVLQNYIVALKMLTLSLKFLPKNSPHHKMCRYLMSLLKQKMSK